MNTHERGTDLHISLSPGSVFLKLSNFYSNTNTNLCKNKGGGWMCTWGVKGRWRGGVAHHSFCQQVVIRVSVVGSEERVS